MEFRTNINFHNERFLMFVLDQMAYEYEKEGKEVIRMTLGKSELPLHEDIIRSMQEALGDFRKSNLVFPGGLPELKEKLSEYYRDKYNVAIKPENYVISVGTSSIFRNLFHLYVKEGDEVLLPLPYYSLYHFSAILMGAKIRYYKIDTDTMALDTESFRENFTDRTRIVVINSPGNPLGNILTEDELYALDSIVNGRAIVINDEIYANICFDEPGKSVMQLKNTRSTFITTDAFSKGYRMYSRRVGYCIVPDELVTPLNVIQHHTLLTLDPIVQFGAITALEHQDELKHLENLYRERRNYTVKRFKEVSDVAPYYSKGGFYITLDCDEYMKNKGFSTSLDLAVKIMESKRVATVPGSDFGMPNTLRLSFSTGKYHEGIDKLIEFFSA